MSDSDVNDSEMIATMIALEESYYTKKSLDFINSYKTNFSPLLASIAETLNNNSEESKALLATMKTMTTTQNSNLKELIVKLKEMKKIRGNEHQPISHNGDYSKYVEQCLRLIQLQHSKQQRHTLFVSVMRDMKANTQLMNQLKTLKATTEWKKMVGMLIPEGANVKILTTVIEPSTWLKLSNKFTAISGKEITGTVVKRAKLTGKAYGGDFKKIVKLQEDLIRNKGDNNLEFSPEHIQLIEAETVPVVPVVTGNFVSSPDPNIPIVASTPVAGSETVASGPVAAKPEPTDTDRQPEGAGAKGAEPLAEADQVPEEVLGAKEAEPVAGTETTVASPDTGPQGRETPEATGSATGASPGATGATERPVDLEEINPQRVKGGSQRLTRKNTKTMGTARKSRTNR